MSATCFVVRLSILICLLLNQHLRAAQVSVHVKTLHTFSSLTDPRSSAGTIIQGPGGAFFGTSTGGGPHGQGTIFRFQKDGADFRVLHSFQARLGEGRNPASGLTAGPDNFLYGTTENGGVTGGLGIVFKIDTEGKNYKVLYSFTGGGLPPDGRNPYAALTPAKQGSLFGTTLAGGASGHGTLFQIAANGTGYRVLHHFGHGGEGKNPRGQLLFATNGQFYGTTATGGGHGVGVIFTLKEDGSDYRLLHSFANGPHDGASPYAGLIEGTDGKLYGTTTAGGRGSRGVIFRLNKDATAYEVLRHFTGLGNDGRDAYGGVVEGKDGALYGVTMGDGTLSSGTIFRITKNGGEYQILHSFNLAASEGRRPLAGLSRLYDDGFYGITTAGSSHNFGAIFRLSVIEKP